MEPWAWEDLGIPVEVGTSVNQALKYIGQLEEELEEEIEQLEEQLEEQQEARHNEIMVVDIVYDLVDGTLEEIQKMEEEEVRKMEEEEELRQHQVMLSEFVRDLVLQVEEVQTMEEVAEQDYGRAIGG